MQAEVESSLYRRFLALSEKFELVPPEFLPIPSDAFSNAMGGDEDHGRDVPAPRLLSASLDPSHSSQILHQEPEPSLSIPPSQHLNVDIDSRSPPGLAAEGSPRRMGRNRTDTMVPSEASSIMEELAARMAETPAELSLDADDDVVPSLPTARPPAEEDPSPPPSEEPTPEAKPADDEPEPRAEAIGKFLDQ